MSPSDLDAREAWNTGADAYIQFVESGADYYRLLVHGPGLLAGEWSDRIGDAGFLIRSLREPRPDAALVATHPKLEDCFRMPYFLIFEILKP